MITDLFSTAVNVPLRDSSLQNRYLSLSLKSDSNLENISGNIVFIFSEWYLSFYTEEAIDEEEKEEMMKKEQRKEGEKVVKPSEVHPYVSNFRANIGTKLITTIIYAP